MNQQWSNEHMPVSSGSPTRRKVNRNSSSEGHNKDVLLELMVTSMTQRQQANNAATVSSPISPASIISHTGGNAPSQAAMHSSADSKTTRGCCSRLWMEPWFRVFMALVAAVVVSVILAVSIRLGSAAGQRTSQPLPTDVGSRLDTVGMTLLFSDNFTSFNATSWSIEVGDGQDYGLQGWGNNELQCYTASRSNLDIAPHPDYPQDDSVLRIRPVYSPSPQPCVNLRSPTSPRHWTSAKVETKNKVAFTWSGQQIYRGPFPATRSTASRRSLLANASGNSTCGRIVVESRMKLPVALGRWSALWMMPLPQPCPPSSSAVECGAFGSWPRSGEIDIVEQVNKDTEVLGTVHYADVNGNHLYQGGKLALSQEALRGWHIFQLVWNCTSLTWYVNAYPTYQLTRQQLGAANWPFDEPFFLIINTAIGGFLTRDVVPDKGESRPLLVDYVRVYGK